MEKEFAVNERGRVRERERERERERIEHLGDDGEK